MQQSGRELSVTPREVAGAPWSRDLRWLLAGVLLVGILVGWFGRHGALTLGGDAASYVIMSHSIAAGHYRDESIVGSPPHVKYPPGMPAWLAVVRAVGGDDPDVARGANLLLLALTALLIADAGRRLISPHVGVALAAAVVLSPSQVDLAGTLLSETLFCFLSVLALWALLHRRHTPLSTRAWALAVIATIAAFLTRSAGIALIGAVTLSLLVERRYRLAASAAAAFLASTLGWFSFVRMGSANSLGLSYGGDGRTLAHLVSQEGILGVVWTNARVYLSWSPTAQFGFPSLAGTALDNLVWALLVLLPAVVGLFLLLRAWPAISFFVAASGVMLLLWPYHEGRLATPLLPFIMVLVAAGAMWLFKRLGAARPAVMAAVFITSLAGIGATTTVQEVWRFRECRELPAYQDPRCSTEADRQWVRASSYAKDSLPDDAVVAAINPATLYLFSHHRAVSWRRLYDAGADTLLAPHGPVTHALVTPLSREYLLDIGPVPEALRNTCPRARSLARFGDGTVIVSFLPSDSVRGTPACPDLLTAQQAQQEAQK